MTRTVFNYIIVDYPVVKPQEVTVVGQYINKHVCLLLASTSQCLINRLLLPSVHVSLPTAAQEAGWSLDSDS